MTDLPEFLLLKIVSTSVAKKVFSNKLWEKTEECRFLPFKNGRGSLFAEVAIAV